MSMARNYYGDDRVDVVNQTIRNDYYNIYTYGGADTINLRLERTYVEAGSGNDIVTSNIENRNDIFLGAGDDTYTGRGYSNTNAHDVVSGGEGRDTFNVSTAISDYYGDGGRDTFNAVGYFNSFFGGGGIDTISYLRQDNDSFLSGRGVRIDLFHEESFTGAGRYETLVGIENAKGTSFADTVIGDNDRNTLWGADGFDLLDGRGGADRLEGGNGNDDLYGGGKNDILIGGKGFDVLEGGSGADDFVFETAGDSAVGSKRDVITDFSRSQGDQIDVSDIADFSFVGKNAFSGTGDAELRFANNILYADSNGDGTVDFEIEVRNTASLKETDFLL
jgi:serralysin